MASGNQVTTETSQPLTCIHKHTVFQWQVSVFKDEVQILNSLPKNHHKLNVLTYPLHKNW